MNTLTTGYSEIEGRPPGGYNTGALYGRASTSGLSETRGENHRVGDSILSYAIYP